MHYGNGITMGDTLGGGYITVKPDFAGFARPLSITTPVA